MNRCSANPSNRSICYLNSNNNCNMHNSSNQDIVQDTELNSSTDSEIFQQVAHWKSKVEDWDNDNRMKDIRMKNLESDNERLAVKVKKLQSCNRNLKQQLDDEKFFYEKEKEYFHEELQSHHKKCSISTSRLHLRQQRELEQACEILQEENKRLVDELCEQNEITHNLYIKFQRVKDSRDALKQKLDQLFQNYLRVLIEMMENLDDAREELNSIVSIKFQHLPLEKSKYLQAVKKNRKLMYENAVHKLHTQKLNRNLERVRSELQILKITNENNRSAGIMNSVSQESQLQNEINSSQTEDAKESSDNIKSEKCTVAAIKRTEFPQMQICENCDEYISSSITTSDHNSATCDDGMNADESSDLS